MKLLTLLTLGCLSVFLPAQQNPKSMNKVGTVDTRFQSYNVEMAEIIGGNSGSRPSTPLPRPARPSNNATPLTSAVRACESWPPPWVRPTCASRVPGPCGALPRLGRAAAGHAATRLLRRIDSYAMEGLVLFAKAADAKIVTTFAVSEGTRNASGIWQPEEARALLRFTTSNGSSIAAAEFVNEPTFIAVSGLPKGYDAAA